MDIQMPELDGLSATAAVRARERTAGGHVPIVALTAHAMAGDRDRCLAAGMDGYLCKPIRADELAAVIEELGRPSGILASPLVGAGDPVPQPADEEPELAREIADLFIGQSDALLAGIRTALAAGDARALERAAHAAKGALLHFGVPAAIDAAQRLEAVGRAGDLGGADAARAVLEAETIRIRDRLKAWRERGDERAAGASGSS